MGGLLAIAVVALATLLAARRSLTTGESTTGSTRLTRIPHFAASELVVFSILIALALYWRSSPRIHKRLMLLGTSALIPAATTRPVRAGSLGMTLGMYGVPEFLFVLR